MAHHYQVVISKIADPSTPGFTLNAETVQADQCIHESSGAISFWKTDSEKTVLVTIYATGEWLRVSRVEEG